MGESKKDDEIVNKDLTNDAAEAEDTDIDKSFAHSTDTHADIVQKASEGTDEENLEQEDIDTDDDAEDKKPSRRGVLIFGIVGAIAAAPLGLGAGYLLKTHNETSQSRQVLEGIFQSQGSITPVNTNTQVFTGQKLQNANVEQKSLIGGTGNTAEEAAVFIFNNGKTNNAEIKIVDVYIDFNSQRSRDFVLINQNVFKNMVENGRIELRIHPVSSGSALSIYSPEALAESFVAAPDKSWSLMISLLQLSAELQNTEDKEVLPELLKKVEENGISGITEKSITNGTFASWIIAVGNDEKLKTDYYPPIVYVNDTVMNPNKVDYNNTTTVQDFITSTK